MRVSSFYEEQYGEFFLVRWTTRKGGFFERHDTRPVMSNVDTLNGLDVVIGIDQSTSATGINIGVLTEKGYKPLIFCDIINNGFLDYKDYVYMFEEWLENNLEVLKPRYVIYEEVGANAQQTVARKRLLAMVNKIVTVCNSDKLEAFAIAVPTWRSHLLSDPKYNGRRQGREQAKAATLEELKCMYPGVVEYYDKCHKGLSKFFDSYDSADAFGIAYGFTQECFINGNPKFPRINHLWKAYPLKYFKKKYVNKQTALGMLSNGEVKEIYFTHGKIKELDDNFLRYINYSNKPALISPATASHKQAFRIDAERPEWNDIYALIERNE